MLHEVTFFFRCGCHICAQYSMADIMDATKWLETSGQWVCWMITELSRVSSHRVLPISRVDVMCLICFVLGLFILLDYMNSYCTRMITTKHSSGILFSNWIWNGFKFVPHTCRSLCPIDNKEWMHAGIRKLDPINYCINQSLKCPGIFDSLSK